MSENELSILIELIKKHISKQKSDTVLAYDVEMDGIKNFKEYFYNSKPYILTKKEKKYLEKVHDLTYMPFWVNEVQKNLNTTLLPPYYIYNEWIKRKKLSDGCYLPYLKNNKLVNVKAIPLAIYEKKNKILYFTQRIDDILDQICNFNFIKHDFCRYQIFKNVDEKTAISLILFFRMFLEFFNTKDLSKLLGMKSHNLVVINFFDLPNNPYLFVLADMGIKTKKHEIKSFNEFVF